MALEPRKRRATTKPSLIDFSGSEDDDPKPTKRTRKQSSDDEYYQPSEEPAKRVRLRAPAKPKEPKLKERKPSVKVSRATKPRGNATAVEETGQQKATRKETDSQHYEESLYYERDMSDNGSDVEDGTGRLSDEKHHGTGKHGTESTKVSLQVTSLNALDSGEM